MALSFPSSPTIGQTYSYGTRTWTWTGSIWELNSDTISAGSITDNEIATGAVTAPKIASGAVTDSKIGSGAVTSGKIGSDVNIVTVCTSSTRPSSPFVGQTIFETDTNTMKVYISGGWSGGTLHSRTIPLEYLVIAGGVAQLVRAALS